jgi:hypothetical protein
VIQAGVVGSSSLPEIDLQQLTTRYYLCIVRVWPVDVLWSGLEAWTLYWYGGVAGIIIPYVIYPTIGVNPVRVVERNPG